MARVSGSAPRGLTGEGLEALLAALDADRSAAADKYELIRRKLMHYFSWERFPAPEDHADEVINRVARRLSQGEAIRDAGAYFLGVARRVALELRKAPTESGDVDILAARAAPPPDDAADCLDGCLERLPEEQRRLILDYYSASGGDKIRNRQRMARERGLNLNALRNRALRLRERLESCVGDCLERDVSPPSDTRGGER